MRTRHVVAGLTAAALLVGCQSVSPAVVTAGEPGCWRPDLGEGPLPWLDNDLAQLQLGTVGELTGTFDGVVDQTIDAANRRAVVLFDPQRTTQADVEAAVLAALRQAITERAEWQEAHAQWLEDVRRGGGGLSPDERRTLLQPVERPDVKLADQQLAVEVRPVCRDPQALREVDEDIKTHGWLKDAGLDRMSGDMMWVINYSLGVVEVRLSDGPHASRIAEVLRERHGDLVDIDIGAGARLETGPGPPLPDRQR
ncbi:MAG TPA: hypothetical protein VGA69_00275 [Nitriliruptorales bacterium]